MVYGRISDLADLERWFQAFVKYRALDTNPRVFSKAETLAIMDEFYRVECELLDRYGPPQEERDNLLITIDGIIIEDGGR